MSFSRLFGEGFMKRYYSPCSQMRCNDCCFEQLPGMVCDSPLTSHKIVLFTDWVTQRTSKIVRQTLAQGWVGGTLRTSPSKEQPIAMLPQEQGRDKTMTQSHNGVPAPIPAQLTVTSTPTPMHWSASWRGEKGVQGSIYSLVPCAGEEQPCISNCSGPHKSSEAEE